jgi:hypothetical protein
MSLGALLDRGFGYERLDPQLLAANGLGFTQPLE